MIRRSPFATGAACRPALVVLLLVSASLPGACSKQYGLVLLDLRGSGPLGAPVTRFRLSASGWPTRSIDGSLGPDGFRAGFYGPADGNAVSVTAEALDADQCVLGTGSATVPALEAGGTSASTTLFIRPQPGNGCAIDPGIDAGGGEDAGGDDGGVGDDGGGDDGGTDAGVDSDDDAAGDADLDASADVSRSAPQARYATIVFSGSRKPALSRGSV